MPIPYQFRRAVEQVVNSASVPTAEHGADTHTNRSIKAQFIPATMFALATGSPTLADNDDNRQSWAMDKDSIEGVSGGVWVVPDDWAGGAVNFYIVWTVNSNDNGNVRWRLRRSVWVSEGQNTQANTNQDTTDAAPGTAYQECRTSALSSTPDAKGETVYLGVLRLANDAADTLGVDAQFLGVIVEYTRDQ